MNEQQIREVVEHQRTYFMSHATMDVSARRAASCVLPAVCHRPPPVVGARQFVTFSDR